MLQVIAMAGSASKTAVQAHVRLIRTTGKGEIELPVHLDAIQKGKQPDILLQANDVLYVPFSWMKNVAMSSSSIAATTPGPRYTWCIDDTFGEPASRTALDGRHFVVVKDGTGG